VDTSSWIMVVLIAIALTAMIMKVYAEQATRKAKADVWEQVRTSYIGPVNYHVNAATIEAINKRLRWWSISSYAFGRVLNRHMVQLSKWHEEEIEKERF